MRVRVPPRVLRFQRFTAAVVIAILASPGSAAAQRSHSPFETVRISVAALRNANRNDFHDQWRAGTGVEVALRSPFYAGHFEAGIDQFSFESRALAPGFRSRFVFVGWGFALVPTSAVRWTAGARLGTYAMRFDADSLPDYRRNENELGTELLSQIGWQPVRAWEVGVSGRFRTVLTDPRIRHVNLSVTLSRDFRTPRWLRDFLD